MRNTDPDDGMPETRGWPAAEHKREPVKMRAVKRQAGREAVEVSQPGDPVHDTFAERVALDLARWRGLGETRRRAHFGSSFFCVLFFHLLRPVADIVRRYTDDPHRHREVAEPFQRALPDSNHPRHLRVFGQTAVEFRMIDIVQHVNHVRAADPGWIVYARVHVRSMLVQLLRRASGRALSYRPCCRSAGSRWDKP